MHKIAQQNSTIVAFGIRGLLLASLVSLAAPAFAKDGEKYLQTKKRDVKFSEMMENLDLASSNIKMEYKMGSTSAGLKVLRKDKYIAYWVPDIKDHAVPEGQVVSYYLGRFLHMSELVAPSQYLAMPTNHLETLENFIRQDQQQVTADDNQFRDFHLAQILTSIQESKAKNEPMMGAIVLRMGGRFVVDNLVFWEENRFNPDTLLAKFIRADQPQPSNKKIMNLEEFYPEEGQVNLSTEMDLAKELSQILVLDMLMGQWDRFSGGNIEARFDESDEDPSIGKLHFLARDNGGASLSDPFLAAPDFPIYLTLVTRFDRGQIKRIELLDQLLESDPELVREILQMKSSVDLLQQRVKLVLAHVNEQVRKYGEDRAYFKK